MTPSSGECGPCGRLDKGVGRIGVGSRHAPVPGAHTRQSHSPRLLPHTHARSGWLRDDEGVPHLPSILRTALEVAQAVEYLHGRAVIHGALHNGNVLLASTGASTISAMSRREPPSHQGSMVGSMMGTPLLASAEGSGAASAVATPPGELAAGEDARGFAALVSVCGRCCGQLSHALRTLRAVYTRARCRRPRTRPLLQVGDYGLAISEASSRVGKGFMRSVCHQAPEVLDGAAPTKAADTYSFGVLLWEMWSGRRAWLGKLSTQILLAVTVPGKGLQVPEDAPAALAALMRSCLAFEAGERPTFPQVVEQLQAQLDALS